MRYFWTWLILALVIGGLAGWGVTEAMIHTNPTNSYPTVGIGGGPINQNSNLQLTLNNLLAQHGVLTSIYLQQIYDNKDTTQTLKNLDTNTQQLAGFLAAPDSSQDRDTFISMWHQHINEYTNYTSALKRNDTAKMSQARQNLNDLSSQMGQMMYLMNSNYSASQITNLMNEHINLTLNIINAYANKDQSTMVNQVQAASEQATRFANYLAQNLATPNITPQP